MSDEHQLDQHLAWALDRLTSDWGKRALEANLRAVEERILDTRVSELVSAESLDRWLGQISSDPFLSNTLRPLVRAGLLLEIARLREEQSALGMYFSEPARALVDELLSRPGLVPKAFVQKLAGHHAFESILRDVLEEGLREFAEKVDPFKAEWGLPTLLKMGGPLSFGLGTFAKGLEAMKGELEKRIEPERKKFLLAFARRALGTVAENIVRHSDEPQFIELRKELFAWLLEQPISELLATQTPPVVELGEAIGHELVRHASELPHTRRVRRATIDLFLGAHAGQTLREALATYGAKPDLDVAAFTDVAWPFVKAACQAPQVKGFLRELLAGPPENSN